MSGRRYFLTDYDRAEKADSFRKLNMSRSDVQRAGDVFRPSSMLGGEVPEFVPLDLAQDPQQGFGDVEDRRPPLQSTAQGEEAAASETLEQFLFRRTREFNQRSRETPRDVGLWLDFARFQVRLLLLLLLHRMSVEKEGD